MKDEIRTEKVMPVLVGLGGDYVMAKTVIIQRPDSVEISIVADITKDAKARYLGEFVAAHEIVSLSFGGVPVEQRPRIEDHKENM